MSIATTAESYVTDKTKAFPLRHRYLCADPHFPPTHLGAGGAKDANTRNHITLLVHFIRLVADDTDRDSYSTLWTGRKR